LITLAENAPSKTPTSHPTERFGRKASSAARAMLLNASPRGRPSAKNRGLMLALHTDSSFARGAAPRALAKRTSFASRFSTMSLFAVTGW
jgi:hypothetical protein